MTIWRRALTRRMTLRSNDSCRNRSKLMMLHLSNSKNEKQQSKQKLLTKIEMMSLVQPLRRLQTVLRNSRTSSSGRAPSMRPRLKTCWRKSMQPVNRWRGPSMEIKLANRNCCRGGWMPGDDDGPSFNQTWEMLKARSKERSKNTKLQEKMPQKSTTKSTERNVLSMIENMNRQPRL